LEVRPSAGIRLLPAADLKLKSRTGIWALIAARGHSAFARALDADLDEAAEGGSTADLFRCLQ
jgi:hypothetical protein